MRRRLGLKEEAEPEENTGADDAGGTPGTEAPAGSGEDDEAVGQDGDSAGHAEGDTPSSLKAFTESEEAEQRPNMSLREILGGDILMAGWLRRQMGLIVLCMFFAIVYITNRYSAEQEMIEIERLKKELTEVRYRALTRSSELTVKTRQSQVENSLRATPDSVLQTPKDPPFLIETQKEEE